jgi:hypothetical protein
MENVEEISDIEILLAQLKLECIKIAAKHSFSFDEIKKG